MPAHEVRSGVNVKVAVKKKMSVLGEIADEPF